MKTAKEYSEQFDRMWGISEEERCYLESLFKECINEHGIVLPQANVSSSALKLNVANWGWKVLSPDNKNKAVALFHRHDDAVQFAVNKWGKYAEWEVKSCDKRIPLHCY